MTRPKRAQNALQTPDAELTLADGLSAYYAAHPGLKRGETLAPAVREFFRCHDAVHVVFGCGTSLRDEAVVKLSSVLGTTGGLGVLRGYTLYDSFDIYRRLPLREVLETIAAAPVIVLLTLSRRLKQTSRWPWTDLDSLLNTTLLELRARFNIIV